MFIWYVLTFMPEAANQLWWGIPGSLVLLGISFGLPILFMHDRDSKDPFEERELWGYKREYVAKVWEERKAAAAADPGSVPKGLFGKAKKAEVGKRVDKWQAISLRNWTNGAITSGSSSCASQGDGMWRCLPPSSGMSCLWAAKAGVFVAFIMAFHVLEEWKFPGGLHWFYNTSVFRPKDESPLRSDALSHEPAHGYGHQRGAAVDPARLRSALLLPSSVERGCAVRHPAVRHGAVRPYGGGVATYLWYRDKGKKTIYHTGLATSLMMFLPAAAYLIAHIAGVTATDWLWCLVLFAVMCCVCVPLTETPLKKWVRKQEPGMFAFEDAKYYMRYGGYCKEDVEQSEARVD